MKGYIFAVLSINTRCGNNRSAEVSADVFNGDIRSAKIWLCTDIKAVSVFRVHFIFDFAKSRTNAGGKSFTIKKEIRKPLPLMNEGLGELRVSQTLFYCGRSLDRGLCWKCIAGQNQGKPSWLYGQFEAERLVRLFWGDCVFTGSRYSSSYLGSDFTVPPSMALSWARRPTPVQ